MLNNINLTVLLNAINIQFFKCFYVFSELPLCLSSIKWKSSTKHKEIVPLLGVYSLQQCVVPRILNHLAVPHSVGNHTSTQKQLKPFYTLYMPHTLYMPPCKASSAIQE